MDPKAIDKMKIGVIGAGIMGQALIRGMLDADLIGRENLVAAVNTRRSRDQVSEKLGIQVSAPFKREWIAETDVFLVCTKPHAVAPVLQSLAPEIKEDALVISIAAGISLSQMEAELPKIAVVRAMPNTPCLIGAGATVISRGTHVDSQHMEVAERIFNSVGVCYRLNEKHMNAVTGVSGAGPAYAYLIMESLADGAVQVGLPRDMAFKLVSQSMLGAAQMMQKTGKHPATLKDEVTTPQGCTISALLTLEDGKIRSTLARAVEEATRKSGQLG